MEIMPITFCSLPDLCYLTMIIKVKLSECLFCTRLPLLTALSRLIHMQPCEAGSNVSILWIIKEGPNLRKVTPGPMAGRELGCEVCFNLPSVLLLSVRHKEDRAWIFLEVSLLWVPGLHTLAVHP